MGSDTVYFYSSHICRSLFKNVLSICENKMGMESLIFSFWEYFFSRETGETSFLPCGSYLLMSTAKKREF